MRTIPSHALPRLLAALLLCVAQGALSATFLLELDGEARHWKDGWECLSCTDPNDPRLQPVDFAWVGLLTVVTRSEADGVYTGSDILSLTLDSNLFDFERPWVASATVSEGQIVSLDAYDEDGPVKLWLSGMTATYDQPGLHHFGPTHATAITTNVPEPATWSLMAIGLGWLAFLARRSSKIRRHACCQITFFRDPTQLSYFGP